MKWSEVAQSCPTLCDPMDCSLPGFSVHGIFQARVLEWVAISFSRGYSWPRDWTQVSCIAGRRFTLRAVVIRIEHLNSIFFFFSLNTVLQTFALFAGLTPPGLVGWDPLRGALPSDGIQFTEYCYPLPNPWDKEGFSTELLSIVAVIISNMVKC